MQEPVIERPHLDDFEQLMEMMYISYLTEDPRHKRFEQLYPDIWRKEKEALQDCFVIKENGRIVSSANGCPIKVAVGKATIEIGGIGGVATHPEHRKKGYMARILDRIIEHHRAKGLAFSWLSGDRRRYAPWGFERISNTYRFTITQRAPQYEKYLTICSSKIKEDKAEYIDWNIIWSQAEHNPHLSAAGSYILSLKYRRPERTVLYIPQPDASHILLKRLDEKNLLIEGYAGKSTLIGYLIAKKIEKDNITIHADLPLYPNEYCGVFKELMTSYSIIPSGSISILDTEKTLNIFKDHLDLRVRTLGIKGRISIRIGPARSIPEETLLIEANGEEINVSKLSNRSYSVQNTLSFTRNQIAELLFSPLSIGWSYRLDDTAKWFSMLFPLPFYLPPIYYI